MIAEVTELDLPDVRGTAGESSAVACLLAVCEYFGVEPHGGGAFEQLLETASPTVDDVIAAAQDLGLSAYAGQAEIEHLSEMIGAGIPTITAIAEGHYVVVFGLAAHVVLALDPTSGIIEIPLDAWSGWGIALDLPGAERHTEEITRQLHPHEALAHHYAATWNAIHDQGERVPHWELNGAHENLSGTDWHVDLGHDGVWRPLHHEDMQRIYLWPAVEKGHGASVEKAGRRRKVDPQQGLFGQWVDVNKQPERKTPQSSEGFEGVHPRKPEGGAGGGRFARRGQIGDARQPGLFDRPQAEEVAESTAPAAEGKFSFQVGDQLAYTGRGARPDEPAEFRGFHTDPNTGEKLARVIFRPKDGPPYETSVKPSELSAQQQPPASLPPTPTVAAPAPGESGSHHAPKGGVTIAGDFFPGGQFIPNQELAKATPEVKAKVLGQQAQTVQNAENQAQAHPAVPTIPAEAAKRVRQTRQRKLAEAQQQPGLFDHGERQSTTAEPAAELLGTEGTGGAGERLHAGQQLGEESAAPTGRDQAGTVRGASGEGRSGQLPDSAGGEREEPGRHTPGRGDEPVSGAGSSAAAVERPAADEGGRGGGETATGALGAGTGERGEPVEESSPPPTPQETVLAQPATPETPTDLSAGNFHYDSRDFFRGGPKAKVRANLEAIRTLKTIQAEGRTSATPEEQAVLSKYVGWGAFAQDMFDYYKPEWRKEREELESLLSDEEYAAARASTTNAHYTHPEVVDAHWQMAQKLGFKGGHFLETSAGIGYYLGMMPTELSAQTRTTAVEKDLTTGAILKLLYPGSNTRVEPFEQFDVPDNFYDLVASNVPFANVRPYDPKHNKQNAVLHDYFFLKSLDLAKPGALVMHITSRYTMDKGEEDVRKQLADKAELVAAVRFPGGAHKENAGTEVVTDLLILRKKDPNVPPVTEETPSEAEPKQPGFTGTTIDSLGRLYHWVDGKRVPAPDWLSTTTVPDPDGGEPMEVNKYFADHPEMILGTLDRTGTMRAENQINVSRTDDYEERLQATIDRLPENVLRYASVLTEAFSPEALPAPGDVRNGGLVVQNGKVYQKEQGQLVEQPVKAKDVPLVEGQLKIRDAVRAVINAERNGEDAEQARAELNRAYDAYVEKHGFMSARANKKAFQDDPDAPVLLALEHWDKKAGTATKADMFRKATIRPDVPIERVGSVDESLGVSLHQTGGVDLDRMAKLAGVDRDTVEHTLVEKGLAFHDPQEGWKPADQYLSGNVRRKLLMARAAAAADPMYEANVKALEKVQPEDIDVQDIDVKLGSPWVPPDDIAAFAASLLDGRPEDFTIRYIPEMGQWLASYSNQGWSLKGGKSSNEIWGTPRKNFMQLLEAALLGKTVQVYDKDADDNPILNREATDDAQAKIQEIKAKFKEWVWEDEERRNRLHRYYNDNYNNIRNIQYNGAHLTFPGMNPAFQMRDVQKNFVWQTIATGKGLLAHEVGVGKTATLIASAMELRRLGLAKKPCLAVKTATLEDITNTARHLYPGARILSTADAHDAASRKKVISQIVTGDYDLVIMSHDQMDLVDMLPETQAQYLRDELDMLVAAKTRAEDAARGNKKNDPTVKELEKARMRLAARLQAAIDSKKKDDAVYWEDTGIDHLLVDEAHAYKSLQPFTRMSNVKGIPSQQSNRATNMLMRTRWLMENNGGRGVTFATGTPIGNTMVELYTMQRYLQPKELEERGIHHFDAWAQTFGDLVTKNEFTPRGKYESVTRFGAFVNMPELMALTRQFMDVQRADDIFERKHFASEQEAQAHAEGLANLQEGEKVTPELLKSLGITVSRGEGGEYTVSSPAIIRPRRKINAMLAPKTAQLAAYMETLKERAESLRGKRVEKGSDNMLVVCTDGKKASVDMRLVDPGAEDDPGSKTNLAVQKVLDISRQRPGVTQLIFTNTRQSKANPGFNLYDDIIDKLVAGGIPRDKIADFSKLEGEKKDRAQQAMRNGEILVGIGGTDTLGTGVNVQNKLAALHHLDVPDRPSDIEQRDGRGYRQGNRNDPDLPLNRQKLDIYRYVAEGSADQTFWQRIANKQFFIDQAMKSSGKELARRVEEPDTEEMDADRFIAMASGDPRTTEMMDLKDEVRTLRASKDRHEREQHRFQQTIKAGEANVPHFEKRIESMKADEKTLAANPDFSLTIDGKTYDDRKEAAEAFNKKAEVIGGTYSPKLIGQYRGLDLYRHGSKFYLEGAGGTQYEVGPSVPSIEAVARRQPNRIKEGEESLDTHRKDIEKTRAQLGKTWNKGEELTAKEKRLAELERELSGKDKEEEAEKLVQAAAGSGEEKAPVREERPAEPTRISDTGWAKPAATPEQAPHEQRRREREEAQRAAEGADKWLKSVSEDVDKLREESQAVLFKKQMTDRWKKELEKGAVTQRQFDQQLQDGNILNPAEYQRAADHLRQVESQIEAVRNRDIPTEAAPKASAAATPEKPAATPKPAVAPYDDDERAAEIRQLAEKALQEHWHPGEMKREAKRRGLGMYSILDTSRWIEERQREGTAAAPPIDHQKIADLADELHKIHKDYGNSQGETNAAFHRMIRQHNLSANEQQRLNDAFRDRRDLPASAAKEPAPPSPPAESASPPPAPRVTPKRVQTKRGERSVHSFAPTESFWEARKAGKIPSNVTLWKNKHSGKWEASVWGANDQEIHDTLAKMRENGVRL